MWIVFNLDGMLFELKVENYESNHANKFVKLSYKYKFENIINYAKYNQEVLLCREIDDIKTMIERLLNHEFEEGETYYCYEPDFSFDFIARWLTINTHLWNSKNRNGIITDNTISITLELKNIKQLYLYLKLQTNEIDINDSKIEKLIKDGIIYKQEKEN